MYSSIKVLRLHYDLDIKYTLNHRKTLLFGYINDYIVGKMRYYTEI